MIKQKREDGFTLVEIIVAIVLLAVISVNLIILFVNMFGAFGNRNLESEIEIETQTLNSSLTDSLKSCNSYRMEGNVLEINLVKGTTDYWYYYIVDSAESKAYLLCFTEQQPQLDMIAYDETDFIARYIRSISLYPSEFDVTDKHEDESDFLVETKILTQENDITYTIEDIILIRNGH